MENFSNSSSSSSKDSSSVDQSQEYMTVSSAPPKRRAGRTKFKETRHPVFKGVRQRGRAGRWVCELRDPNNNKSRIWVGTFSTAEMAARAHDVAVIALRGRKACLNFADSAWRLPAARSRNHDDIRRAAVLAAEQFGQCHHEGEDDDDKQEFVGDSESVQVTATRTFDAEYDTDVNWGLQGYYYLAEGMLVEPPALPLNGFNWDEIDGGADVSLWSYNF